VARDLSLGRRDEVTARARQGVAISLAIATGLALVLLAATPLIKRVLEIDASLPVVLTAVLTIPSLLAPALWGAAQGLQRFAVISGTASLGASLRLAFLAALIPLGLTVDGALAVTVVASVVTALATVVLLAPVLRRPAIPVRHSNLEFLRETVPVAVGTLAVTALTTIDLLVAKIVLPSTEAGEYGGASLVGRLILYVPATIATVLLPKVTSRAAVERDTADILRASLAVTVGISLLATLVLATLPRLVLDASFGSEFEDAAPLLWLFGIAMTQYAVLNVLLIHDLGHHSSRVAWLLIGGAGLQLVGYALFHESAHELLYVSIVTGSLLLLLYALVVEPALRRRLWQWVA
jgi:O-antigen/teichoic acid export membrane protein